MNSVTLSKFVASMLRDTKCCYATEYTSQGDAGKAVRVYLGEIVQELLWKLSYWRLTVAHTTRFNAGR